MWTKTYRKNLDRINVFKYRPPTVFVGGGAHFNNGTEKPWTVWIPLESGLEGWGDVYFVTFDEAVAFVGVVLREIQATANT